ncbi:MAG: hypothetical protein HY291_11080 [Planctomycetes bacterium]|nr:hypothetical protein [Planctomycetota bacterium]
MAQNYIELQAHLNRVRWAWKRAAALQGLAAVVIEGVGMFLVFVLLDYVYVMPQPVRIAALALMGAALAYLFVRHVLRPLLRPISDEQLALYVEERQTESEGALLSATAFGKEDSANRGALYRYIVDNIVNSAVQKAGGLQLARVLNLAKLRKYGIAAAVVLLFFAAGALKFSGFFGHRANRLLMPWQMSEEDLKATGVLADSDPKLEFQLTLDPQDRRVLRGSSVRVKAKLSMSPREDVRIKFRAKGSAEFQTLKMDEIEEVNSFAMRLPDINDDLEFFVQSGRQVSENVTVSVFDRLEIKGYEVTLTPPAYTKQKPTVDFGPSGDLSALAGTKVTLRALSNTPLATGEIAFDDGKKIALTQDEGPDHAAKGAFTVEKDASYTVAVSSADKQTNGPSSAFTIHLLKDEPPSAVVLTPNSDMAAPPGAEVEFTVRASDDVGLEKVELVFNAAQGDMAEQRIPFVLEDHGPGDHEVTGVLPLGELKERQHGGDSIFYHVDTVDLKGQRIASDIYMLKIRPYEIAGAFPKGAPHARHPHPPPLDLMLYIAAVWNIHVQKDQVDKAEYDRRCGEMASKMVDEQGLPRKFKKPKIALLPPDKVEMVKKGDDLVAKGIKTLQGHDAAGSVAELRQGLALYERAATGLDFKDKMEANETGDTAMEGAAKDPMKDALGFLKMDIPKPTFDSPPPTAYEMKLPEYRRSLKADDAKKLKDEANDLQKKQQQLVDEAKKLAMVKDANKPNAEKPGEKKEAGEAKSGEEKTGEEKSGEQAGEQKSGEEKSTETAAGKSGEQKEGAPKAQAAQGGAKKPGDPKKPENGQGGQQQEMADVNERKEALERDQKNLANDARKLAQRLAKQAPNPDKDTKEVLEHFRQTTKQMDEAAKNIAEGKLQQAAARGEEAKKELAKAAEKLQVSQYDNLEQAVEAAEDRAQQIAETQRHIREATGKVLDEAKQRDPKAGAEKKLSEQEMQKMRGLAKLQVDNQKAAENLEQYVQDVAKWAESMNKKEATDELKHAAKTMKQEDLAATMVTAAVNMAQQEFGEAKDAQAKLDKTLEKLTGELRAANGAMAQTKEQKLKRAVADAKDLLAKAKELGGLKPDGKDGEQKSGAEGKEGKEGAKTETAGKDGEKKSGGEDKEGKEGQDGEKTQTAGKNGEKKSGAGKEGEPKDATADAGKTGAQGKPDGKSGEPKGEHKSGDEKGETAQAKNPKDGDNKGDAAGKKPLSDEDRKQAQAALQRGTARLAKRLEEDKLADAGVKAQLVGALGDEKSFEEMFKEGQKTKLDKYLKSLKTVETHLEDKLESALKAKRLSASQREQTPTQYREMVNKYYEQLAKE